MIRILLTLGCFLASVQLWSQEFTTNRNPVGMEHNILFNATKRYTVTQTGTATLNLNRMFDGMFTPSYTTSAPSETVPTVIEISELPQYHTQQGAWVGWSTRLWNSSRFKIEGFNVQNNINVWKTLADYSNTDYTNYDFVIKVPTGTYAKLRFTFYTATGVNGNLGVSELFFIYPEIVAPYEGLYQKVSKDCWTPANGKMYYTEGEVGIGTTTTGPHKLAVEGSIGAREVKVEASGWSDFVFEDDYNLPSLEAVEKYIKEKGHLQDIPSADEVEKNGINLGEMNAKLLQKIEELTLYVIQQNKENKRQQKEIDELKKMNARLVKLVSEKKN